MKEARTVTRSQHVWHCKSLKTLGQTNVWFKRRLQKLVAALHGGPVGKAVTITMRLQGSRPTGWLLVLCFSCVCMTATGISQRYSQSDNGATQYGHTTGTSYHTSRNTVHRMIHTFCCNLSSNRKVPGIMGCHEIKTVLLFMSHAQH